MLNCGYYKYAGFSVRAKSLSTTINKSFVGTPEQHVFTWTKVINIRDNKGSEVIISITNDLQFHVMGWDSSTNEVFIDERRVPSRNPFVAKSKVFVLFNDSQGTRIINANIDEAYLTDGSDIVAHIVACRDKVTNEAVFYDIPNKKEFRASGLICGPDVA